MVDSPSHIWQARRFDQTDWSAALQMCADRKHEKDRVRTLVAFIAVPFLCTFLAQRVRLLRADASEPSVRLAEDMRCFDRSSDQHPGLHSYSDVLLVRPIAPPLRRSLDRDFPAFHTRALCQSPPAGLTS
jgi:hypothetical protein